MSFYGDNIQEISDIKDEQERIKKEAKELYKKAKNSLKPCPFCGFEQGVFMSFTDGLSEDTPSKKIGEIRIGCYYCNYYMQKKCETNKLEHCLPEIARLVDKWNMRAKNNGDEK